MRIPVKSDSEAFYEKLQYGYSDTEWWCLTRNGQIVRWLDEFEVNKIESVIDYMTKELG
jgi:hypothetical protein